MAKKASKRAVPVDQLQSLLKAYALNALKRLQGPDEIASRARMTAKRRKKR